jgi:uncharacterized protein YabN with tetrapyrrole methylase and pyrophosphatase domain
MLSNKLQRKALSVGVVHSEDTADGATLVEMLNSLARKASARGEPESDTPLASDAGANERLVGELLFEVADLARQLGVDAEHALRTRATLLRDRIMASEGVHNPQVGTK